MTDYNDGNWHGWNGGECPVHPGAVVTCMWQDKDGFFDGETDKARAFSWHNIDAFRVVKEYREPREFWVRAGMAFGKGEKHKIDFWEGEVIHVREVIDNG